MEQSMTNGSEFYK